MSTVRASASSAGTGSTLTLTAPVGVSASDRLYAVVTHGPNVHFPNGYGAWDCVGQTFRGDATVRTLELRGPATAGPWVLTMDAATTYTAVMVATFAPPNLAAWVGDFETGDLSQYSIVQAAAANRIEIRSDGPYQGSRYARFTCYNTDVAPLTPTVNPRAQLGRDGLLYPGMTRWISWATRFPTDFPATRPVTADLNSFLVFAQIHGAPFHDSPAIGFGVDDPDLITFQRNALYGYDTPWSAPLVRGVWQAFALHVYFAADETGWVELWHNGAPQTFKGGVTRLNMATIQADQKTGVQWIPTLYRCLGMYDVVSVDHDAHRIDVSPPPGLK